MKMYSIKPEYVDKWSSEPVYPDIVSDKEIKRLASEWCVSVKSLMAQVEPLERKAVKVERFCFGEYYVDVEERNDPQNGLMWDAWIGKGKYGLRSYMIGIYADQTKAFEPHIVTHDEAIELIFTQFAKDIEIFEDDIDWMESREF